MQEAIENIDFQYRLTYTLYGEILMRECICEKDGVNHLGQNCVFMKI